MSSFRNSSDLDEAEPRRSPGWKAKASILAAATLLSLLAGEVVVRTWFRADFDTELIRELNQKPEYTEGLAEPALDPERVFELKKGLLSNWGSFVMATDDKEARRISSFAPPPANPAVRVAIVGDSTAFGLAVPYDSTYGANLEVFLAKKYDTPVELRIYGMVGYNSTMIRSVVEKEIAAWHPDLLIIHYDHNDPNHAVDDGLMTDLHENFGDNFLRSALVKFVIRRSMVSYLKARYEYIDKLDTATHEMLGPFRYQGRMYDDHLEEIHRIGEIVNRLEIPTMALIFDGVIKAFENPEDDPHYNLLHVKLKEAFVEAGIVTFDLYPEYQNVMKESGWTDLQRFALHRTDFTHPNPEGHYFIAVRAYFFILNNPFLNEAFRRPGNRRLTEAEHARIAAIEALQQGLRLTDAKRREEAEEYYREALRYNPDDPCTRIALGYGMMDLGHYDEAIKVLAPCLKLKGDFPDVYRVIGLAFLEKGEPAKAVEFLETTLNDSWSVNVLEDCSKKAVEAYVRLARELEATDPDGAVGKVDRAIEIAERFRDTERIAELENLRESIAGRGVSE